MFHCTCNTNDSKKNGLSQETYRVRIKNDTPENAQVQALNLFNNKLLFFELKPNTFQELGGNNPFNMQFSFLKNQQIVCTVFKTLKMNPETVLVSNILNEGTCTHYSLILKNDKDYPIKVVAGLQTGEKMSLIQPLTILNPNSDTVISNPIQAPISIVVSAAENMSIVCKKTVNLGNPLNPPTVKVSEITSQENWGNCKLYYQEPTSIP